MSTYGFQNLFGSSTRQMLNFHVDKVNFSSGLASPPFANNAKRITRALGCSNTHSADCIVSCIIGFIILSTFYPLSLYTGRILLQSAPSHVVPQLDRCLREALTIDGVLEFKNENFWTVSFGKLVRKSFVFVVCRPLQILLKLSEMRI